MPWRCQKEPPRRAVRRPPQRPRPAETIANQNERLAKLTADEATANEHAKDPISIGGRSYARDAIADVLGGKLDALPWAVQDRTRVPLGTYRGLRFGMVLHPQFPPDVYLEGNTSRTAMLSREHQGPRAVLNALDRLAGGFDSDCERVRQDLAVAEGQFRDYQARVGKPFTHDDYLTELTGLRDQLKTSLSVNGRELDDGKEPSTSDLATRIKTLKAANTVEAIPQRSRQKHSTAEEPVTSRIRRRQNPDTAAESETEPQAVPEDGSSVDRTMTFRERIIRERQSNGEGQSPS